MGSMTTALSSCGDSNFLKIGKVLTKSISSPDDVPYDEAAIARIPYASLAAKIGDAPNAILILGQVDNHELFWFSADKALLVTLNGRVIQTAGLPQNLKNTQFPDPDPIGHPWTGLGGKEYHRSLDFDTENYYGIIVSCHLEEIGEETLLIQKNPRSTLHLHEVGHAQGIDWEFENDFWIFPDTGTVWKSRQIYTPAAPAIEITILKPYVAKT